LEIASISYEQDKNKKWTVVIESNPKEGLRAIGFLSCLLHPKMEIESISEM
jgi:hypothetical protein